MQNTGPAGSTFSDPDADYQGADASSMRRTTGPQEVAIRPVDLPQQQSGGYPPVNDGQPRIDRRMGLLETQCVKLSLAIMSRPNNPATSLGFTSAVSGEGKTFLATMTATALARESQAPVTLVDCNWERPTLHTAYNIPASPGLAEWLRHECSLDEIRHAVSSGLTVIPAGDSARETVALTTALKVRGLRALQTHPDEALIFDMPPVLTTSYVALLSQQLDAVLLVVRAGTTWDSYVQEASFELSAAAVEGIVLNGTRSRIPQWLQRIL